MAALLACAGGAPAGVYPENTVLLLVAGWCAPCRAELSQIDAIENGAAPFRVRVMLVYDSKAGQRMVAPLPPAQRWVPDGDVFSAARAALLSRTPGLPYAAAFDGEGRLCAERRGGLDPSRVRAMVAQCHTAP